MPAAEVEPVLDWSNPAHWYDSMNPWGAGDEFYLALVMGATDVLDIGCGTGTLLNRARTAGHGGRLCGIDPDPEMLDQARPETTVEWVLADAASVPWDAEFDLALMTGHAFQVLCGDDEVHAALTAIRRCLRPGGRFTFETRHPAARAWDGWEGGSSVTSPDGDTARVDYHVLDVDGDVVHVTETMSGPWWDEPQVGDGRLRFMDPPALAAAMADAGFSIEEQFGGWDRRPLDDRCEEIVTIATAGG